MNRLLRVNTLGCRWDLDLSALKPEFAARVEVLWARAAAPDADVSEPDGFPQVVRVGPPLAKSEVEVLADEDVFLGDGDRAIADEDVFLGDGAVESVGAGDLGGEGDLGVATKPEGTAKDADLLQVDRHRDRFAYSLSGDLTRRSVAAQAGRMTMLHGAALALPETGATLVLVAPSGTGKTTATRTLGRFLGYLTDETAAIRPDMSMLAHPKPLSMISGPDHHGHKEEFSPDELGLLVAPADTWLAATVILRRDDEFVEPRLEPSRLMDALIATIPQSSSLPTQPEPLSGLARVLTQGRGVHLLSYAEIDTCRELIVDLLVGARAEPGTHEWTALPPSGDEVGEVWEGYPGEADPVVDPQVRYVRAPWRDALKTDGEILVLNGPLPMRLMGIGTVVWLVARTPSTLAEIAVQVVAECGHHPDAEALVADAIREFLVQGLLRPAPPTGP